MADETVSSQGMIYDSCPLREKEEVACYYEVTKSIEGGGQGMSVRTKYHDNPSHSFQNISVNPEKCQPPSGMSKISRIPLLWMVTVCTVRCFSPNSVKN